MGLREYIIKRSIYTVILLFFVIILNFAILEALPGSPLDALANPSFLRNPEQLEAVRRNFGLNEPIYTRFLYYVRNMLTFEFGYSYGATTLAARPISEDIGLRLGNTLALIGLSSLLAIVIGMFLGVYAASRRGGVFDTSQVTSSLVWGSLPTFWMGIIFILIFAFYLDWFPISGVEPITWSDPASRPQLGTIFSPNFAGLFAFVTGRLQYLFLPLMVLTLFQYGGFLLLTRATMVESLTEDYVLTARAKGLSERKVLFKHALKNASLPIITAISLQLGFILSGAIITETVFNYQGMGLWIYDAITDNDYPAMQAIFYLIALMVIIANFINDLILGWVDPRIKYG